MQFPSITIDPEWCPAECLGRHVALSAPGTRGMNLWELQCMMSLARQAVRCMLDPWGEVRCQSRRVLRELEVGGGNGCVEALRGLLSSMDELRLWRSTRSLQGEKGVSRDADGLDVDANEAVALDAHADDWLDDFRWRELVVRVRDALQDDDVVDDAWRVHVDGGYAVAAAGCSGKIESCNVMELALHRDDDASLGQSSCMRVPWHRTNPVVGRDGCVGTAVSLEMGHRMVADVAHLVLMRRGDGGGESSRWRISSARPVSSSGDGGGNLHGSVAFAVEEVDRMGGELTDATRLHVLRMLRTHMLGDGDDGLVWAEMDGKAPKREGMAVDAEGDGVGERMRESHSERAREERRRDRDGHRDERGRDGRRRDRDGHRDERGRDSRRRDRDDRRDERRRDSRKRSRGS